MPKRSSKPTDLNRRAWEIVQEATRDDDDAVVTLDSAAPEKNPAAVALGRLGGKKGGPARARKLTAEQRREIAKRAAQARWEKDKKRKG